MTTSEHTQALDIAVETVDADTPPAAIPAFRFPFKPGELAKVSKGQPSYPGAGKSSHDKRPGVAPSGTRRSMGKR